MNNKSLKQTQFGGTFLSSGRKATYPSNSAYSAGIDIDVSQGRSNYCTVEVPYPAECCGTLVVTCLKCKFKVAFTAAGRSDDPRSVTMPCKSAIEA